MTAFRFCLVWLLGFAVLAFGQAGATSMSSVESLLRAHHVARALQSLKVALRTSPNDTNLWTLKGIALSMQGKNRDASVAFQNALHIEPDNLAALRGEAQILDQEHAQRALPLLRRIITLSPNDATAHEMLALDEQREGDCIAAIADFHKSGPAMQEHPESLAAYGSCLNATGKSPQAITVFQHLDHSYPNLRFAKYDLALVLCDARHYHQALQVLMPVITNGKADPDTLSLASEAYEAVGNTPKAVATLRQAIVEDPANVNLYNSFAELCLDHQSYKVGIDMIDAGLRINPNAASLYLSRGLLYAELSNFAQAQSDFAAAEHLNPRQGVSAYAIDMAELEKYHFDTSHSNAALKALRTQLHSYPHNFLLHYLLAKLLSMEGPQTGTSTLADARSEAETAVQLKPGFVAARDLLALIDLNSNDFSAAARQSLDALHYDPNDRTAVYHLIAALRHSKTPKDQAELRKMAQRLGAMERNSLQTDTHRKRFRLVEAPPPTAK